MNGKLAALCMLVGQLILMGIHVPEWAKFILLMAWFAVIWWQSDAQP